MDTLDLLERVDGDRHWRGSEPCGDRSCELHWPAWIREEQEPFGFAEAAYVCRAKSRVALLIDATELRVTTLDDPDNSELVLRFCRPTPGREYVKTGSDSTAAWSPDGCVLAGTLEKWQPKTRLDPEDMVLAERSLERTGFSRHSVTPQRWERLLEWACAPLRFRVWTYRFIADLERREVAIEPGALYPYFAPIPSVLKTTDVGAGEIP